MGESGENKYEDCLPAALGDAVRIFGFVSDFFFPADRRPAPSGHVVRSGGWRFGLIDVDPYGTVLYFFSAKSFPGGRRTERAARFLQ